MVKILVALKSWWELLKAWLALTIINYQRNSKVWILLSQWLALTMLRATDPQDSVVQSLDSAKKVKSLYLTSVVPSVMRLVSVEVDGVPFTPLPLSVLRFTGIQSYGYRGKLKQTFRSLVIEMETCRSESHALAD